MAMQRFLFLPKYVMCSVFMRAIENIQPQCRICYYSTTKFVNAWKKSEKNQNLSASVNERSDPRKTMISLHDQDDKLIGHFSKFDADKMARDLNLKLVFIRNSGDLHKSYYKLMTGSQLHEERLKLREEKKDKRDIKDVKIITIKDKIAQHDLTTRFNTISKWLKKNHQVQLLIEGSTDKAEIIAAVEKTIEGIGNVKNKVAKKTRVEMIIHPITVSEADKKEDN